MPKGKKEKPEVLDETEDEGNPGPKMEEVPLSEDQYGILVKRHRRYTEAMEAAKREQETINDFCTAVAGRPGWELDPGADGRKMRLTRPVDPREDDAEA